MTEAPNNNVKFPQKCPPPLPPPPPDKYRRNRSRFAVKNRSQCDIAKDEKNIEAQDQSKLFSDFQTITIDTAKKSAKSHDRIFARGNLMTDNNASDDPVPKSRLSFLSSRNIVASSERTARGEEYPSLFFTLRDFEDVMSATWNRSDPVNETSVANLQDTHLFAHSEIRETESQGMLGEDDDVCFRVTTTNLPFEKCLGGWKNRFGNDAFDDYQFGNNTRDNRITVRESSNHFDKDDDLDHRVGTKVRFVIESVSPIKSNCDYDAKINMPCDSLRSCESILDDERINEETITSSVQPFTDIYEEFAEVKDDKRDKSCTLNIEKRNFATEADDPLTLTNASNVDEVVKTISEMCYYDKSNDINCERTRREDSNSTSWGKRVENENLGIDEENTMNKTDACEESAAKQMDQKETLAASSENAEHIRRFTDDSIGISCTYEEANAAEIIEKRTHWEEEIFSKRSKKNDIKEDRFAESETVCINESNGSPLNDDMSRDNSVGGSSKRISINHLANKLPSLYDSRQSSIGESEERITRDCADSKIDCEKASPSEGIFSKSVPVKVRRDSFLETMLLDDPTDVSLEYAMISIPIAMPSQSVDKELSAPHESANKVRKLDSARVRERSCGFDNTIKVHTENEKVLKDIRKMGERTAVMPSANAKSVRLENKNAGDAKNDVLNELLCNFSNIKLKIVNSESKRPATRIGDEKNIIARPIAIDNKIFIENEAASSNSRTFEECRNENRDIIETKLGLSVKETVSVEDEMITGKIIKDDLARTILDPTIGEKIARNKTIAVTRFGEASFEVEAKTAKRSLAKSKVSEKDVRSEDTHVTSKIEKTSKNTENEISNTEQEMKKSRDVRTPKAILKKKSVECEEANQFQKRIPIGAPATMNKIFDSRELGTIADASRRGSLEKRARVVSKEAGSRVGEKTDEGMSFQADADPREIASRPAEDATSSDDKCAIARRITSVIPCNNNDNKRAVTAVANVSNDQSSRDVVTITPGKVRSFVKYYEIRGDATTAEGHSKINDREKVAKRKSTKNRTAPIATRSLQQTEIMAEGKKETEGGSISIKSNDAPETSLSKTRLSSRMPKDFPDNSVHGNLEAGSKLTGERERKSLHVSDKTHVPLAKSSVKKSVQFRGGFTVIRSAETFDENEEFAGIIVDHDADASKKKKVPGIPLSRNSQGHIREIAKLEKLPDTGKDFFPRRQTVAQIRAVANYEEESGINRFVAKPETPRLVFYCTV